MAGWPTWICITIELFRFPSWLGTRKALQKMVEPIEMPFGASNVFLRNRVLVGGARGKRHFLGEHVLAHCQVQCGVDVAYLQSCQPLCFGRHDSAFLALNIKPLCLSNPELC